MNCPNCNSATKVLETRTNPAGQLIRRRRCLGVGCAARVSTIELLRDDVRLQPSHDAPKVIQRFNLESELDQGLRHAVEYILDSMKTKAKADKIKMDAAKWLIEDHRRRRAEAAAEGKAPPDPGRAQLEAILALIPTDTMES
jgi:transcriptional regulator NrdR family protein